MVDEQGLSVAELARKATISRESLYKLLAGKVPQPRSSTIRLLAQALGVSILDLTEPHDEVLVYARTEIINGERVVVIPKRNSKDSLVVLAEDVRIAG